VLQVLVDKLPKILAFSKNFLINLKVLAQRLLLP
jgi:hypothetical protein